jgi:hypothetical protein
MRSAAAPVVRDSSSRAVASRREFPPADQGRRRNAGRGINRQPTVSRAAVPHRIVNSGIRVTRFPAVAGADTMPTVWTRGIPPPRVQTVGMVGLCGHRQQCRAKVPRRG